MAEIASQLDRRLPIIPNSAKLNTNSVGEHIDGGAAIYQAYLIDNLLAVTKNER